MRVVHMSDWVHLVDNLRIFHSECSMISFYLRAIYIAQLARKLIGGNFLLFHSIVN